MKCYAFITGTPLPSSNILFLQYKMAVSITVYKCLFVTLGDGSVAIYFHMPHSVMTNPTAYC